MKFRQPSPDSIVYKKAENAFMETEDGDANEKKAAHRMHKALEIKRWYQQFDWPERPAQRGADGKWPYIWPGVES